MIVIFLRPHLVLQALLGSLQGSPGSRLKVIGDLFISQIYTVGAVPGRCATVMTIHHDPTAKAPEAVQPAKTENCRPFLMVTFLLESATVRVMDEAHRGRLRNNGRRKCG